MIKKLQYAVLRIDNPNIAVETINEMLRIAFESDLCEVKVVPDNEATQFELWFHRERTSIFISEWVKYWMRPFDVEFKLSFEESPPEMVYRKLEPEKLTERGGLFKSAMAAKLSKIHD